jgi:hypothetical protein
MPPGTPRVTDPGSVPPGLPPVAAWLDVVRVPAGRGPDPCRPGLRQPTDSSPESSHTPDMSAPALLTAAILSGSSGVPFEATAAV